MIELLTIDEINRLIAKGKPLHIAGDEKVLARLDKGNWIGGTIPYFLTSKGGLVDRERAMVAELPAHVVRTTTALIDADRLDDLLSGAFEQGFSLVIAPGLSPAHAAFATGAQDLKGLFERPLVGWIAGVHLSEISIAKPKVFDGVTGTACENRIVVMHAECPQGFEARIGILNLFDQNRASRSFRFPETGFAADACLIDGEPGSFYDFAKAEQLDLRLPLVADYSGEKINVSFQNLDDDKHRVNFYAPVVAGVEYKQAAPLADYRTSLVSLIAENPVEPALSFNCILNYLFADLEGDRPLPIGGPATFGEIAYVLLNQTLVYLTLDAVAARGTGDDEPLAA